MTEEEFNLLERFIDAKIASVTTAARPPTETKRVARTRQNFIDVVCFGETLEEDAISDEEAAYAEDDERVLGQVRRWTSES